LACRELILSDRVLYTAWCLTWHASFGRLADADSYQRWSIIDLWLCNNRRTLVSTARATEVGLHWSSQCLSWRDCVGLTSPITEQSGHRV